MTNYQFLFRLVTTRLIVIITLLLAVPRSEKQSANTADTDVTSFRPSDPAIGKLGTSNQIEESVLNGDSGGDNQSSQKQKHVLIKNTHQITL